MILEENNIYLSNSLKSQLLHLNSINIDFKDKHLVPIINNISLHSTYYPLKESKKIIFPEDQSTLCIAIGFGAGYHLIELSKQNRKIIAIPIDKSILTEILKKINLSQWFKNENLKLINEDEILHYFDFFKYKYFNFIIHPVLQKMYPKKVNKIINNIGSILKGPLLEINTQRKFGKLWFYNIIKNILYFFENGYNFEPLIINKKPILITGAGPSLFENIDIIIKNKEKLFIAATDTSLKILNKFNIKPDIAFTFDSQQETLSHFIGVKNLPRLFTDFTSIIRLNENQTIVFSNHPVVNIFKKTGWNPVLLSSNTRNIGGAIIDFFLNYFPDYPIITVGIDYGIYKNQFYSKGSYSSEYKYIYSTYYKTENNIDIALIYRDKFNKIKDKWKSTNLFEKYSKSNNTAKNVYSLSTSPFTNFNRIKTLKYIIDQAYNLEKSTLFIENPNFSKDDLISIFIEEIKIRPQILYSYFLSANEYPNQIAIEKIIQALKKI